MGRPIGSCNAFAAGSKDGMRRFPSSDCHSKIISLFAHIFFELIGLFPEASPRAGFYGM